MAVFEGLGFKPEALLRDNVRDGAGQKHDIATFAHDVTQFHAQMEVYGLTDAL